MPIVQRLVWCSDVFGCADDSTGMVLTPLAGALTDGWPVAAWTVRGAAGLRAGIEVRRLRATAFSRLRPALLGVNLATTTAAYALAARRHVRPGDLVVVATSPRLLPAAVTGVCGARRIPTVVVVYDVYPDALAAAGWLRPGSRLYRIWQDWFDRGLRRATRVVVLGEDMRRRLAARLPDVKERIRVVPNWADTEGIRPQAAEASQLRRRLAPEAALTALYAGTLGRTHDAAVLLEAAERLRGDDRIRILVLAAGARAGEFARGVAAAGLGNVVVAPPVPRAALADALAAGDVNLLAFKPGMAGVSVPSRIYNVLAAGRALVVAGDADSEAVRLIREEGLGWAVAPGDGAGLAETLRRAVGEREQLAAIGVRARRLAEERYSLARIAAEFRQILAEAASV